MGVLDGIRNSALTLRSALTANGSNITSSTTLQTLGLSWAIGASATEIWLARYVLFIQAANTTMDAKLGLTLPAAATALWGTAGGGTSAALAGFGGVGTATTPSALLTGADTLQVGTPSNNLLGLEVIAVIFGGGTAGSVDLTYAQNTSDAGALAVQRGSLVEALRFNG